MAVAVTNKVGVATAVLHGIGAPVNNRTVGAMVGWFNAEGGNWNNTARFNPLNTTLNVPGSTTINGVGVRSYNSWQQGINATVATLKQSNMSGIVQALHQSDPQAVIHAIASSPWGTNGNLVAHTIGAATGQQYQIPTPGAGIPSPTNKGIAQRMAGGGSSAQADEGTAIADSMMQDTTGTTLRVENPIAQAGGAPTSGLQAEMQALGGPSAQTASLAGVAKGKTLTGASINMAGRALNDAQNAGAGTDAQKLLSMIHQVIGGAYNQGNHGDITETAKQIRAQGTDCSGLISWLMGPQGLGIWNTTLATPSIDTAPGMQAGRGQVVTVWNNKQPGNAGHVFIQIGNSYFASEGGVGIRQISASEASNYIQHGSDGGTYEALHPKGL